ncbi:hypothetical protein [Streptomyces fulvorobeus]|uniref:Uncharacterized protein n=1 Tax=Streptomyces fulvorobeus TaxID=284028 RepID=A0A7J0CCE2_9ACTN|nr:hypothetical protein [Streptomyces fulvorobeus]NYE43412.1 hypothetical protein [Streptomyces fulvorobeus]GFM99877.1 hypothetical protein Sfulv_46880 [Streptomyces fulvorobeus]
MSRTVSATALTLLCCIAVTPAAHSAEGHRVTASAPGSINWDTAPETPPASINWD